MSGIRPNFLLKIAWLTIALLILATSLLDFYDATNEQLAREIGFRHLVLMSLMSLPIGPAVLFVVDKLVDIRSSGLNEIIAIWISCVVGGYIQWFYLIPKAIGYLKRRKKV
jgi:hypothetical protein